MTMKPEYNYGHQKTYSVHIYNSPSIAGFLRKIIFWMLFRRWDDRLNTSQSFEKINDERLEDMKPELEKAHSYRVCEKHHYSLFRNDILIADLPKRILGSGIQSSPENLAQFHNNWYSQELTKVNEYSFELWARNEQIKEAYRLTILPSFSPARVIRIWKKDDVTHLLYKIGRRTHLCKPQAKHEKKKLLKTEKWQEVHKFMKQNFWTAETWYSVPANMMVFDGEIYLFEGWQNGEYKLLDDHSPDDEYVSARAMKLFMSLTHRN